MVNTTVPKSTVLECADPVLSPSRLRMLSGPPTPVRTGIVTRKRTPCQRPHGQTRRTPITYCDSRSYAPASQALPTGRLRAFVIGRRDRRQARRPPADTAKGPRNGGKGSPGFVKIWASQCNDWNSRGVRLLYGPGGQLPGFLVSRGRFNAPVHHVRTARHG